MAVASLLLLALALQLAHRHTTRPPHPALATLPSRMLWAWERTEDLRWLPDDMGVAYVAASVALAGDAANVRLRPNPLYVDGARARVPVVHVDASGTHPPTLSVAQRQAIVDTLLRASRFANRRVVQLDFEVRRSQRDFLREVIHAARAALPADTALSVTALASWCQGDAWMRDVDADEIVPMAFRMAAGDRVVREQLAQDGQFRASECKAAVGVATDEPLVQIAAARRYYFSPKPWTAAIWHGQINKENARGTQ
ncbi:MAG: hypothetical protein JO218_06460 [Burkholderiales bacterium]|nr:hypothetical protein [Burkholderiales bacterium]